MTDIEPTTVIFRKWRAHPERGYGDGIIALFPCIATDSSALRCLSYEHVGQHGPADPGHVMDCTRAATADEYAAVKRELEAPPFRYVFDVRLRIPRDAAEQRRTGHQGDTLWRVPEERA
jgi:hypothetical protein